ncbi:MAG: hypothetical protein B6230_03705 [Desulfobacteraceae bacterium 4572_89]|nr:MAG: hypothetical protein B6230_03705 [Desulfobacteraceae bacterium 4572_89]
MNDFLQSLRNGQAEKPRTPKTRKNSDNSYHYTSSPRYHSYGGYQNTRNPQMKHQQPQSMAHQAGNQAGNQIPAEDSNMNMLADVLDNLTIHIETMVKNQEDMVNAQERTADILERQAIAIERIANHLSLSSEPSPREKEMNVQPAFENHYVTSRKSEDTKKKTAQSASANASVEPTTNPLRTESRKTKEVRSIMVKTPVQKTDSDSKPILRKRRKIAEKNVAAPASVKKGLMPRDEVMGIILSMREEGATFDQVAHRLIELGQPTFSGRGEWHAQTIHRLCSKK